MIKQIISFGFVESLAKGLNFLVLLLLPLFLPVKEFGVVGIIVSIEALFSAVLLFGQDRVILRYYPFEENKKSFLFSVVSVWALVATVFVLLILVALHFFPENGVLGIKIWPDAIFLLVIVILSSFRFIFVSIVRTEVNLKQFTIDKIVFQILKIAIIFFLASRLELASSYIYGMFIATVIVFFLELFFLREKIIFSRHLIKIKRNWSFGFPFVFHVMAGSLLVYFNRFVLEQYTTLENVALYTFASNLGLSITFVYAAFIVFFEPQIYKYSNDIKKSEKWLGLFSLSTLAINAIIIGVIILVAPVVIDTFFDKKYLEIVPILPIILISISFNAIYLQSSYRLTIYEKTKFIPFATIIAGLSNVVLNFYLVPKYGLYGAAITTLLSYLVLSLVTFLFSIKYTFVSLNNIVGKYFYVWIILVGFSVPFFDHVGVLLLNLSIFAFIIVLFLIKLNNNEKLFS